MYDYCLVYYLPFYSSNQSSTPFKKVTQHDFDRLYFFYPGFLFTKIDILESLFICLSIDALFVGIVLLGRVQGE